MVLVLYGLGIGAWLLMHGVRVTLEDGFYYFKIAEQIARGAGSTFDGFSPTNGYHPLWLLSLVPFFWLTGTPHTALTSGIVCQAFLLGAAAVVVYYTVRLTSGRFAASLAAVLWVLLTYRVSLGGLEFGLHAFGILGVAYVYLRWFESGRPQPPGRYLLLSTLLSLTFLSRLDTIFLAGIIAIFLAAREWRLALTPDCGKRLWAFAMPLLLTCFVYAGTNLYLFGHPAPVSSAMKRTWSAFALEVDPVYQAHGFWPAKLLHLVWPLRHLDRAVPVTLVVATVGITALALFARLRRPRSAGGNWLGEVLRPWAPFILYSWLSFLGYALVYHQSLSYSPWYFAIQPWLTVLLAAALSARLLHWAMPRLAAGGPLSRAMPALALIGLAATWCGAVTYTVVDIERWRADEHEGRIVLILYDGAAWARANLPVDAVVGAWNAGAIGYLSGRRVVNLDGLVNSWAFRNTERLDLCGYWERMGVSHLLDIFDSRFGHHQPVAPESVYLHYARCVDRLELLWRDDRRETPWRLEAYRLRRHLEE